MTGRSANGTRGLDPVPRRDLRGQVGLGRSRNRARAARERRNATVQPASRMRTMRWDVGGVMLAGEPGPR